MEGKPPLTYIPEFCQATTSTLRMLITELKEWMFKNDIEQSLHNEKILVKNIELEKLYYLMDKELLGLKTLADVVSNQSKINVDFSGNFKSIEKRIKIIFTIVFMGVSAFSTLVFICVKFLL